jgi:hypothetical protein
VVVQLCWVVSLLRSSTRGSTHEEDVVARPVREARVRHLRVAYARAKIASRVERLEHS